MEDTRFIIYHMMLKSDRRIIHEHVLNWHRRSFTGAKLQPYYSILAHQCMCCDRHAQAFDYFVCAIEAELLDDTTDAAMEHLQYCAMIIDQNLIPRHMLTDCEIQLDLLFGQACIKLREWESASLHLSEAVLLSDYRPRHGFIGKLQSFFSPSTTSKRLGREAYALLDSLQNLRKVQETLATALHEQSKGILRSVERRRRMNTSVSQVLPINKAM